MNHAQALAPLARLTNYGLSLRQLTLANYHTGRALRMRAMIAEAIEARNLPYADELRDMERWHRAHAAELRAEAGERLRMIRARGMTERYTDCDTQHAAGA